MEWLESNLTSLMPPALRDEFEIIINEAKQRESRQRVKDYLSGLNRICTDFSNKGKKWKTTEEKKVPNI